MNMTTTETGDPVPIKAIPLRRPGRWIAAVVVVVLCGLFVYGAATNEAFAWGTYGQYLFDKRISAGAWTTIQLTVLAMVIAIVLGVIFAVMRLSPNPVLRAAAWGYLWIFRGTPVYVQLVFWGLFPSIYKSIDLGIPVRTSVCAHQSPGLAGGVSVRGDRFGTERGCIHGRDRPCRHEFGQRGPDRSICCLGYDVESDDAPNRSTAGDARDHSADR